MRRSCTLSRRFRVRVSLNVARFCSHAQLLFKNSGISYCGQSRLFLINCSAGCGARACAARVLRLGETGDCCAATLRVCVSRVCESEAVCPGSVFLLLFSVPRELSCGSAAVWVPWVATHAHTSHREPRGEAACRTQYKTKPLASWSSVATIESGPSQRTTIGRAHSSARHASACPPTVVTQRESPGDPTRACGRPTSSPSRPATS